MAKKEKKNNNLGPFGEIISLFRSFIMGILAILDACVSLLFNIIVYFVYGLKKIGNVFAKIGMFFWKHGVGQVCGEIAAAFKAFYGGVTGILGTIFVKIPGKVNAYLKEQDRKKQEIKRRKEAEAEARKYDPSAKQYSNILSQIYDYLLGKYENIPFVKKRKEEREKNLKPLKIDKNSKQDTYRFQEKQTFRYLVRNKEGKLQTGYFPAFSKLDCYSYLVDQDYIVYEIYTSKMINFLHTESKAMKSKMAKKDLIFWLTQLSTYIKAGIPLMEAVKVLARQDKRKKYQSLYESLIYELTMGVTFSEALNRQGKSFPALLINMVKASELSGTIEETLDEMSQYYQEMEDNRKDVISAISYPIVVLVFALGICTFMLVYIVPKFAEIYDSMGSEINSITQFCLDASAFLQAKGLYILGGIVVVAILYGITFRQSKGFRTSMQTIFLKLPVVNKVIVSKEINMFARTFASLQHNNVLIADCIDVLAKITENELYKKLMDNTITNLIKGNKMSESFKDNWIIPDIAYFMITTGEQTGQLADMLDRIADYYRKEQKNAVNGIKTFVEPALIVFLAVCVGFILIAILVPMFDMYQQVM